MADLEKHPAYYTFDPEYRLWYFAPLEQSDGPYKTRQVRALIDIAGDGTLAGVELIDDMPTAPANPVSTQKDYSIADEVEDGLSNPFIDIPDDASKVRD